MFSKKYIRNIKARIQGYNEIYFHKHYNSNMSQKEINALIKKAREKKMKLLDICRNRIAKMFVLDNDLKTINAERRRSLKYGKRLKKFIEHFIKQGLLLEGPYCQKWINDYNTNRDFNYEVFYKPGTTEIIVSDKNRHNRRK